jgi:uracil-DNA glycosylase
MTVSSTFDPGPPAALAKHFAKLPSYADHRELFWYDWGPVFYRGRLDGSAKFLGIGSDPGPAEQVACRTLVGDAGQRVQGFLTKLGLTSSYVLVNAHPYALHPSKGTAGKALLDDDEFMKWRNKLLDLITGPQLQAIVAFGAQAQRAAELWAHRPPGVLLLNVPHPSSRSEPALLTAFHAAINQLRAVVTPDVGGHNTGPNYGAKITENDYAPIPRGDLGFGVPPFLGDDAWARTAVPRRSNGVKRNGDLKIVWDAPKAP